MAQFWDHFLNNGLPAPRRRYLGLQGHAVPIKRRVAGRFELEQTTGVAVQVIEPRSPAEDAGILEGDVIVQIDGRSTTSADELSQLLANLPIDIPVSLLLLRGERVLERLVMARSAPRSKRRRA